MKKTEKPKKRLLTGPYERVTAIELIDQMIKEGEIFEKEEKEALINSRNIILRKFVEKKESIHSTLQKPTT